MFREKAEKSKQQIDAENHFQVLQQTYLSYKMELESFEAFLRSKAENQSSENVIQQNNIEKHLLTNIENNGPSHLGRKKSQRKAEQQGPETLASEMKSNPCEEQRPTLGKRNNFTGVNDLDNFSMSNVYSESNVEKNRFYINKNAKFVNLNSDVITVSDNHQIVERDNRQFARNDLISLSEDRITDSGLIEYLSISDLDMNKPRHQIYSISSDSDN